MSKNPNPVIENYNSVMQSILDAEAKIIEQGGKQLANPDRAELDRQVKALQILADDEALTDQTMLMVLWNFVKWEMEGIRSYCLEYQVRNLRELAQKFLENKNDLDYTYRKVMTIEGMFIPLYLASISKNPFVHPETGEVITPEYFIETPGYVKKLKVITRRFAEAVESGDSGKQQNILDAVVTQPASAVENLAKTGSMITLSQIPYRVEEKKNGRVQVTLDITVEEFYAFQAKLGRMGKMLD